MTDRNQAAKDREQAQRELNQQLQKFARQLNEGKTGLLDRFGIKLMPGHYVIYRPTFDLIFEVVDVVPILDATRPPGYLTLKLSCTTSIEFVAGQRGMSLIKCGEKSIEGDTAVIQPPGSVPPEGPPPASDPANLADGERDDHAATTTEEPPDAEKLGGTD